jgi:hypothetical protein
VSEIEPVLARLKSRHGRIRRLHEGLLAILGERTA